VGKDKTETVLEHGDPLEVIVKSKPIMLAK
jgi:hypothetical protein